MCLWGLKIISMRKTCLTKIKLMAKISSCLLTTALSTCPTDYGEVRMDGTACFIQCNWIMALLRGCGVKSHCQNKCILPCLFVPFLWFCRKIVFIFIWSGGWYLQFWSKIDGCTSQQVFSNMHKMGKIKKKFGGCTSVRGWQMIILPAGVVCCS